MLWTPIAYCFVRQHPRHVEVCVKNCFPLDVAGLFEAQYSLRPTGPRRKTLRTPNGTFCFSFLSCIGLREQKRIESWSVFMWGTSPSVSPRMRWRVFFSEFGEVQRVHLVMDRETGRPRGFGFVEMGDDEGRQAIQELMDRNAELGGRPLKLNEAQPREERGGGGSPRRWRRRRYRGGGRGGGG